MWGEDKETNQSCFLLVTVIKIGWWDMTSTQGSTLWAHLPPRCACPHGSESREAAL